MPPAGLLRRALVLPDGGPPAGLLRRAHWGCAPDPLFSFLLGALSPRPPAGSLRSRTLRGPGRGLHSPRAPAEGFASGGSLGRTGLGPADGLFFIYRGSSPPDEGRPPAAPAESLLGGTPRPPLRLQRGSCGGLSLRGVLPDGWPPAGP